MRRINSNRFRSLVSFTTMVVVGFAFTLPENSVREVAFARPAVVAKIDGLGVSPYKDGQDPNLGTQISIQQLTERLQIVANNTVWVRSFGCTHGLENFGMVAHSLGLKAAVGAWLSRDLMANDREIANLIAAANAGQVDIAIVGSEVLLRNDLTETQLIAYINQVRQQIPANIPVGTADVYGKLLEHPAVINASSIVLPNFYPYWEGKPVNTAIATLHRQYQQIVAVAGGKPIVISETGWPSAGNTICNAVPSPENAAFYFLNFVSWAKANNVSYYYFSGMDENWKSAYEGPQGAHWGLYFADGTLKPGMQAVFDGQTIADNWTTAGVPGGAGTPQINFVFVPPFGAFDNLFGQVLHVNTDDYKVAVYIQVSGGWWTKPTFASPVTNIELDGSWECDITTGGSDQNATKVAAFLIPKTFAPPQMAGGPTLPSTLDQNAVARADVDRSSSAPYIGGQVLDSSNRGVSCVTMILNGTQTATSRTTSNGNFAFINLPAGGNYTVTPTHPSYIFNPPSATFNSLNATQTVVFSALPKPTPVPACSKAQLVTPANNATISPNTTFTWTTGTSTAEHWLTVGTSFNTGNILDSSQGLNTSKTLGSLPNGPLFVRLWSRCSADNTWPSTDYQFTVAGGTPPPPPACTAAQLTSPANNSNIAASTTFNWNTGGGNVEYWLTVGTSQGAGNVFDGSLGVSTSKTLSGLPSGPIFVRLWSRCGATNNWPFIDYSFTVGANAAYSVTAAPLTVNSGSNITVNWTAPVGHSLADWVGLYRTGTAETAFLAYQYLPAGNSGTLNFGAPATPGVYEFRCYPNNGFTRVATSNAVNVSNSGSTVTVLASPSSVGPGSAVTVNWTSAAVRAANDWIGLYAQGAADTNFISFQYIGAPGNAGTKTFTMPVRNGTYEFRYFLTDSYSKAGTSNTVTVTGGQ